MCPGRKFAQVEFVAVMATLMREYRVSPVLEAGETVHSARERVMRTVNESHIEITLQMNKPKSVKLAWKKR